MSYILYDTGPTGQKRQIITSYGEIEGKIPNSVTFKID